MLDPATINKIEEFVYAKPRSVQEVADFIGKNWRTADRYIEEIEKNFGTVSTRVFRGGTRGALKIIYWSSVEKVSSSIFQEKLEKDIVSCKRKENFFAFDIFQYVPMKNKKSFVFSKEEDNIKDFSDILLSAKRQVLIFSGNLSFINIKDKNKDMYDVFDELVQNKINVKILCRVDLAGMENIERILSLNLRYGIDMIEIRHDAHPIRGVVVDGKFVRLKEVKEPTGKIKELNKTKFIFYNISDKSWAEWLAKIFWKKFSNSINANKRLDDLKLLRLGT